jgi:DNA modification methylase
MQAIKVMCDVKDTLDYKLIKPLQGNYKKLEEDNLEKLCNKIKKRGIRFPSFVAKIGRDVWAIDTHQRLKAYERLEGEGYKIPAIPVVYIRAKDKLEAKQLLLECDSRYGEVTQEGYIEFTADLDLSAFLNEEDMSEFYSGLNLVGIDIEGVIEERKETQGDDDAPAVRGKAVSKPGEMYKLGNSILLCGDSTDAKAVKRLMGSDKADMVFTDPPYGINIVKGNMIGVDFGIAKKGKYNEIISDNSTETAQKAYNLLKPICGKMIIWGGNYFVSFLSFSDGWIIWDKRVDSGIRNSFADGEMAWCSFHTSVRIYHQLWNGMIREGEHDKRVHPTQKPVKVCSDILSDFTKENDIILDVFGGSGTTLIAAEKSNRKARLMEIDPHYCDVIRRRWTKWARENGRDVGSGGLE